jgi:hypothetical protein
MADNFSCTTTLKWDPSWKAAQVAPETTKALLAVGNWWKGGPMPIHFRDVAVGIYGYKPRTRGYTARKWKKFHHRHPLVWSGSFRANASAGRIGVRGKNRQEVRLIFVGGFPDRRRELFARVPAENEKIRLMVEDSLVQFLRARVPEHPVEAAPTGALAFSPGDVAGD